VVTPPGRKAKPSSWEPLIPDRVVKSPSWMTTLTNPPRGSTKCVADEGRHVTSIRRADRMPKAFSSTNEVKWTKYVLRWIWTIDLLIFNQSHLPLSYQDMLKDKFPLSIGGFRYALRTAHSSTSVALPRTKRRAPRFRSDIFDIPLVSVMIIIYRCAALVFRFYYLTTLIKWMILKILFIRFFG
jgi:hypothetical protein